MEKRSHGIRNGLICAFVVASCLWAAYPVAEMGFIDDWSYIKTAQVFAQTGHFVYKGWAVAMLGWQVVWGALFIKLIGFSFTVVRLSMLPIAMATVLLFHATLLRFGINARNAVLGTLTLGLSPLFLPLAVTYMSDVPGLFVILLCLYLCQRAVAAETSRATIVWLCIAALTNVVGGTARQTAWLGTLVMVPSAGWMLRKRQGVLMATALLWPVSMAIIFGCLSWFARQPNAIPEPLRKELAFARGVLLLQICRPLFQVLSAALCLSLMIFPILVAWLFQTRKLVHTALRRIAWITLGWILFQLATWTAGWTVPWLPSDILQYEFAAVRMDHLLGPPPLALNLWAREAISLLVVVAVLVLIEYSRDKLWPLVKNKSIPQEIWWLLGPFSIGYLIPLLPRAYHAAIFDRYLLPLMPIAIVGLLRLYQEWIAPTLPAVSVVMLGVFALLAIAGTHDWFAFYRARLAANEEIQDSGVPRTQIQGGFEYDGWTQIEDAGAIDGAQFMNDRQGKPLAVCEDPFAPYTPAIHPQFTTIFGKMCLEPSEYPPVRYRTWLPPYGGTIYVRKVPGDFN